MLEIVCISLGVGWHLDKSLQEAGYDVKGAHQNTHCLQFVKDGERDNIFVMMMAILALLSILNVHQDSGLVAAREKSRSNNLIIYIYSSYR